MWVTKLLISPVQIRNKNLSPRTTKFGPKLAFLPGLVGSFAVLLVGWLVVVAHRLYSFILESKIKSTSKFS